MHWSVLDLTTFVVLVGLILIYCNIDLLVNFICKVEEPEDVKILSRHEFLSLLDYYDLTITEQVLLCLKFLGLKELDLSLSDLYLEIEGKVSTSVVTVNPTIILAVLTTELGHNTQHVIDAISQQIDEGYYTNVLDAVEDIIADATPHYHMRFD